MLNSFSSGCLVVGSSLIPKKGNSRISRNNHSLSFVFSCSHSMSLAVTLMVTRCYSLYHSLSLVAIRCPSLYHSLSPVVTRCRSMYHSSVLRGVEKIVFIPRKKSFVNPWKISHFQSMKSPVELNSLFYKTILSYHLVWWDATLEALQTRPLRQILLLLRNNSLAV